jgi:hypothetical protein
VISYDTFRDAIVQSTVFMTDAAFNTARALKFLIAHDEELTRLVFSSEFTAEFPPEVPRLVIQSEDMRKRVQAGPSRLDVFVQRNDGDQSPEIGGSLAWSTGVLLAYVEQVRARVFRLACVLTRRADTENPAELAAGHFCQPFFVAPSGAIEGADDFDIRFRKRFEITAGLVVNNWLRCSAGPSLHPTLKELHAMKAISVEQDINTIIEYSEARSFELEEVEKFFALVPNHFDKTLRDVFPGAQR